MKFREDGRYWTSVDKGTGVSMNMWGVHSWLVPQTGSPFPARFRKHVLLSPVLGSEINWFRIIPCDFDYQLNLLELLRPDPEQGGGDSILGQAGFFGIYHKIVFLLSWLGNEVRQPGAGLKVLGSCQGGPRSSSGADRAPRPGLSVHELPLALAASDRGRGGGVLLQTWGEGQPVDGVVLGAPQGENMSLFLEAATLEELEWVIGKQMGYYNNERRHSRLEYRSPVEYLASVGFIPKTLAEIGLESGSVSEAQARMVAVVIRQFTPTRNDFLFGVTLTNHE